MKTTHKIIEEYLKTHVIRKFELRNNFGINSEMIKEEQIKSLHKLIKAIDRNKKKILERAIGQ